MKTETVLYVIIASVSGIALIALLIRGLLGPSYSGIGKDKEPPMHKEWAAIIITLTSLGFALHSHHKDKPRAPCSCEVPTSTHVEGSDNILRDVVRDRMLPNPNPMSRGRVINRILKGFTGSDD